jgi:choice-of-anchor B domain-containing protein
VTLLSHLNLHPVPGLSAYSNNWRYVHPDGREYAAVGTRFGVSIVRLTDPVNPVEVAFIPSIGCTTRDVDQYQTYLYAIGGTCGNTSDPGLQIISMADPDHPVLVSELHGMLETSENITIDASRGLLFAGEVNQLQGANGIRIISLADPLNPTLLYASDAYDVHDLTVKGTRAYLSDVLDGILHVVDTTNPSAPVDVASFSTNGPAHSAWPTDDDRYLCVTNENLNGGEVIVYDALNPTLPVETWRSTLVPLSTAHYPRVLGNRLFVAHYSAGVRILDLSNPAWPVESGYLDTFPGDNTLLGGAYDVCPFYPSGIATTTDFNQGLYVFRVNVPNYGLVRGTVMESRAPLAGVTVRALPDGPSTTTGPDGRYGLSPTANGSVTIEVSKFGYVTQSATRAVAVGSDQTVNFTLQKSLTGTIKGTVVRSADQGGLGDVEVTGVGTPLLTLTSPRGTYSLTKVPEGAYAVRADRPGYVPAQASITVIAKKTTMVNFALASALFYDDAEVDRGWTLGAPGDNATAGQWIRAVPVASINPFGGNEIQPGEDHTPAPGTICFVTGNGPVGGDPNAADVDGGRTTLISPVLPLGSVADPRIAFWRFYFSNNRGATASPLVTELSNDGGATWVFADSLQTSRTWERLELRVTDFFPVPGNVQVRFIAQDRSTSAGSTIEALIDDFEYYPGTGLSSITVGPPEATVPPVSGALVRVLEPSRAGETLELRLVAESTHATVRIFDVRGRLVRTVYDGPVSAGNTRFTWDRRADGGERAAAGVYMIQAKAGEARAQAKIVVVR